MKSPRIDKTGERTLMNTPVILILILILILFVTTMILYLIKMKEDKKNITLMNQ